MNNLAEYIGSGILEIYVVGAMTAEEAAEVERLAADYPEIRQEIKSIQETIAAFALTNPITPKPETKELLLQLINDKIETGPKETPLEPLILSETSLISDYSHWIKWAQNDVPSHYEEMHVKIISSTPEATTALLWLKHMPYSEVHDKESERFLILEGTCEVLVEDAVFALAPGDYFAVPLHAQHTVRVTSEIPCMAIVQRVAI